jgi:hypothetical protein
MKIFSASSCRNQDDRLRRTVAGTTAGNRVYRDSSFWGCPMDKIVTFKELRSYGINYSRPHLKRLSDPKSEWYQGFPMPVEISPGRIG